MAGLGRRMVDAVAVIGKEIGPADIAARQRSTGGGQGQPVALGGQTRLDPGRARRGLDQPFDLGAPGSGQGGRAVAHRQGQRQGHGLGHAHLVAAHEKQRVRRQGQDFAGPSRGRGMDRHGQQHLARIAVVHQAHQPLAAGQGPQDGIGRDALGQGPCQAGGPAGIAGIAPIGVPAGRDLLAHRHDGGRSRRDPLRHRDQFGLDPLGPLRAEGDLAGRRPGHRLGLCRDGRQKQSKAEDEGEGSHAQFPTGKKARNLTSCAPLGHRWSVLRVDQRG